MTRDEMIAGHERTLRKLAEAAERKAGWFEAMHLDSEEGKSLEAKAACLAGAEALAAIRAPVREDDWAEAIVAQAWCQGIRPVLTLPTSADDAVAQILQRVRAPVAPPREEPELRHALWIIAGTIVALADDPVEERGHHARSIALSETSPLVDAARDAILRFGLSNETAPASSPLAEGERPIPVAPTEMPEEVSPYDASRPLWRKAAPNGQ